MKKIMIFEKVYDFCVIDEMRRGEKVYVVDRAKIGYEAIRNAKYLKTDELLKIIDRDNSDNRYEFFKKVYIEVEENANDDEEAETEEEVEVEVEDE